MSGAEGLQCGVYGSEEEPERAISCERRRVDQLELLTIKSSPTAYPDVLPELSLDTLEGELEDDEMEELLGELHAVVRTASRLSICLVTALCSG